MKKILLVIKIIIISLKLIGDCSIFAHKDPVIAVAAQEEESKNEQQGNKQGKLYPDEINSNNRVEYTMPGATAPLHIFSNDPPYSGFNDEPHTPPPNYV